MLTGRQRSYLKSIANGLDPIIQIGKNGISENLIKQIDDALEAREIIKVKILNNSLLETKETANKIAKLTDSEFVQSIGNKFVLYRESKDNKKIELP
ncbi:ribosome assembly RNA-binding protein YhbY [Caloranaerobacter azorensis]|uniref:RNA-binding protein n=3 Tax=Caloranaerobacter azorensis TaxID=116090 RepID=A0A1M5TGB9_9FIRM|nr:ribosome assembly RNA-binding protein YhbY [Caloranaerobacter azorensis]KGG80186.1 RNA-binding protein [Caloranaerobacter azorensis H53214]QIB26655.1 ribosome assembly RNA-binding protein YhbY [Caloranaerobacter azorensis]SHH49754.1 RNA-binding protein [Caloranaerobacter azorensis DSM 13643]